ncbi:phosphomannose isomerase type II C-terminal cupin domain [Planktothrix agardhii]|jgi:mannose-6-phosphate isomerase-like protein (cupin superfamily)|uniref:Mannose-6-phosphate isomerase typeII n=2 Tax=Planktothrix agardhii TaxID=1160 RepID=A0A073CI07_PLAA1|nr:phosphomannose isomerase type II C-terminal cupin domain [Planktothrix agardhii]BBD56943.1 mannose-6-phosphate isomerase [Planktothrix agardhii NIES-204]KEI67303.1 mannose-6-phosphate isomerase typeII [Planktothrix agardhii NIVA-CYA 126/8]MBG0745376.1 phosphomannose isomerase type II C-terminal cupin domain [Planktothrix agardhii KL2]MCB8752954.1 phosphomannose isomerase type II C-terminal cupin domain [Planktothrix agardhii 1810]MCB8759883.1 phosphomannose isomerase type II C-terminal cupi
MSQDKTPSPTLSEESTTRTPPWGQVSLLEEGERYRINRIVVNPGYHISTQMHYHRSEHWIVVAGTARVICGGEEILLLPKQSTYVPMNTPHRLENPGVIPLVMIEVQNGEYLGDDDITRFPEEDTKSQTKK